MQALVALSVAPDPRGQSSSTAGLPGERDGVLDCAVRQPPRVAPVQALLPRLEELLKGGNGGILLFTGPLGHVEVERVAATVWLVRENEPCGVERGWSVGKRGTFASSLTQTMDKAQEQWFVGVVTLWQGII